jgi:cell division protein FtsZ
MADNTQQTTNPFAQATAQGEAPASIAIVGVGGGGCNSVMRMVERPPVPGIKYICVNTDVKSLGRVKDAEVIQIGRELTHGLGAGGIPDVGAQAAQQGLEQLRSSIGKKDLVFVVAGMGGGTGTGAAPVVAQIAHEAGALVVAVVTTPFSFEGPKRLSVAHSGIMNFRDKVDNLVVIHNDRLSMLFQKDVPMAEALRKADEALFLGVLSVAEVVNVPGEINVDFADLKTVMKLPGLAVMAIGTAANHKQVADAAKMAIENPLLDLGVDNANGLLFSIRSGPGLTLGEVNAVGGFISSKAAPDASIFFGMVLDPTWEDRVQVTIIATGIPADKAVRHVGLGGSMTAAQATAVRR